MKAPEEEAKASDDLEFFFVELLKVAVVTVVMLLASLTPCCWSANSSAAFRTGGASRVGRSASCSRWSTRQVLPQRGPDSDGRLQATLSARSILALGCALISIAVIPFGEPRSGRMASTCLKSQRQHRSARHSRHHFSRRLRHRARRLVVE